MTAVSIDGVPQVKNVNQALMSVPESNIQFKNVEGSPVSITAASGFLQNRQSLLWASLGWFGARSNPIPD